MVAAVGLSLSGVAGFGGGVVILPVLVWFYGPAVAVPVVAIFQLLGTSSRVWLNRHHLNWKVAAWFAAGSTPFAVLGSFLFISHTRRSVATHGPVAGEPPGDGSLRGDMQTQTC